MLIGIDGNEANIKQRVGANQYAFELLKELKEIEKENRRHTFIIYLRDKPLSDMPSEGANWHYRTFGPKRFWTQWRLPVDLFAHRPRPEIFFTPGHYSPRWSPIPRVISIMDLGYLKFPQQFTPKDLYQLRIWTARSVKSANHIFAISEKTKNDIIEAYKIPVNRITVTYPGYDANKFKIQNSKFKINEVRKKYKIEGNYILFLGTLKPSKNIEGLLEAYKILTDRGYKGGLVVAGKKGWLYDQIFGKVKKLELDKRVVFTDFVPEEDIPVLMSGAEVFVLPSFWEGFGIPILEAMASGVPVVASNVGSLSEVVGNAGVLVNPHHPEEIALGLEKAFKNKKELIDSGRKRVQEFSWNGCAKQTLEVLVNI